MISMVTEPEYLVLMAGLAGCLLYGVYVFLFKK
jgi:hypothetical protein